MVQIGHDHFCIPNSEYNISSYKDIVDYAEFVYSGFDDDWKDGFDDKSMFYQDKAKAKRLLDWLKNAPIDDEVINTRLF